MRVLFVDDRAAFAHALCAGLRQSGLAVDLASCDLEGSGFLLHRNYSLVVLALREPQLSNFTVLKAVRASNRTPVIVVMAQASVEDRVRCLENDADDVLTHPVAMEELLTRLHLHAQRARNAPRSGGPLVLADLTFDLARKRAERAGHRLDLTRKEYALLMVLIQRPGEIISRAALAEQIWDMPGDATTNAIDVAIGRLRLKLDDPYPLKLLHTVRGLGYVLEQR